MGYHTYDGLVELLCENFPRASSVTLHLRRTETTPTHMPVARLTIAAYANRGAARLKALLTQCLRNRDRMSLAQMAEVNSELMRLRGKGPYRRVKSDDRLVGFFVPELTRGWKVHRSSWTGYDWQLTVTLPPGQSPQAWAESQLSCGFETSTSPWNAARELSVACGATAESVRHGARVAYGKQLSVVANGTTMRSRCHEARIFEQWGDYDIVGDDTAVIRGVPSLEPSDMSVREVARLLEAMPNHLQRNVFAPEDVAGDAAVWVSARRLMDDARGRVHGIFDVKHRPTRLETELAGALYKRMDPLVRVEDDEGRLVGYAWESSLMGWLGTRIVERGDDLVRVRDLSWHERESILVTTWWRLMSDPFENDEAEAGEVMLEFARHDCDEAIRRLYARANGAPRKRNEGWRQTLADSREAFEEKSRGYIKAAVSSASSSRRAASLFSHRVCECLDASDAPDDIKQMVRDVASEQAIQEGRPRPPRGGR